LQFRKAFIMAGVLQHLRSSTLNKRPNPASMVDGQVAINYASGSPGMFFKDSSGALVKVGPVHVGSGAPNVSPASGGTAGNSLGEQWLDTSGGTYVFKIWDGSAWRSEAGEFVNTTGDTMTGALGIIAGSASTPGLFFSGDTSTGIYSPGADQVAVATNGTGRLFVDASGRVGVGTSSPGSILAINDPGTGLGFTNAASGNFNLGLLGGTSSNEAYIYQRANGPLIIGTNNTERLRITSAGLVGVGTSSPGTQLHINAGYDGSVADRLTFSTTFDGNANSGSGIYFKNYYNNARITAFSNPASGQGGTLQLQTYNSDVSLTTGIVLNSAGNVGIGTTSPGYALDIVNNSTYQLRLASSTSNYASGGLYLGAAGTGDPYYYGYVRWNQNSTTLDIAAQDGTGAGGLRFLTNGGSTSPTERARIDVSGRLLVGTSSSPSAGLGQYALAVVQGYAGGTTGEGILSIARGKVATSMVNTDTVGQIAFTDNAGNTFAKILSFVDGTVSSTSDLPGGLTFSTTADGASSPTERMRINNAGEIGIGIASVANYRVSVRGQGNSSATYAFITDNTDGYGTFAVRNDGEIFTGNTPASSPYNNTTATAANMVVTSGGILQRSTSSIKYKTNVETLQDFYADAILQMRPVWYQSTCKNDNPSWGWWGFIAEEVAAIDPRLVHWKTKSSKINQKTGFEETIELETPEAEGVQYDRFVPHLLNLIKRQKEQIEAMEARLSALESV
jgi:hypothetical protein